ncbi:hypothetical protein PG984_008253 [Apiospora sp. TS-2023a]
MTLVWGLHFLRGGSFYKITLPAPGHHPVRQSAATDCCHVPCVAARAYDLAIWIAVFTFVIFVVRGLRFSYVIFKVKRRGTFASTMASYFCLTQLCWRMEGIAPWDFLTNVPSVDVGLLDLDHFHLGLQDRAPLPVPGNLPPHNVVLRRLVWLLVAVNTAYIIVFISFFITQCGHVSDAWDPVRSVTSFHPREIHEIASGAVNLALDLSVIILPLPTV